MNTIIYYPLLDNTKDVQRLQDYITHNPTLFTDDITKATVILVAGGDGYMMHILKEYQQYDLPFVGVNFGRLGFLMNTIDNYDMLPRSMDEIDLISEQLPHLTIVDAHGKKHHTHMVNDLVIGKSVIDYFCYTVQIGKEKHHIQGTALMLSTAIGSTAYWLSNGGPVISLASQLRGLMGIATMPFDHKLISATTITIDITGKSPADVGVDGHGGTFSDVKHIVISPDDKNVRLGFLKTHNFDAKRLLIAEHKGDAS